MRVTAARLLGAASDPGGFPRLRCPEIAFAGRSNSGKSSLLNRLAGRRGLAHVSKTPGRTQRINFFLLNERLVFADLPGYGFARVPAETRRRWKPLVEASFASRAQLRGVVVVLDSRRGIQDDDRMLGQVLRAAAIPVGLAATKIDKLGRAEWQRRRQELSLQPLPGVRAVIGTAAPVATWTGELWREIDLLAET